MRAVILDSSGGIWSWRSRQVIIAKQHCPYRYDIALLYLGQADYDLDGAVEAYQADERWEREHPMGPDSTKGKIKQSRGRIRFAIGGGITGQLS